MKRDSNESSVPEKRTSRRLLCHTAEHPEASLEHPHGESALTRLAELADQFDAEQVAADARSLAERVSEGLFYVACIGQFKRGKSSILNALVGNSVLPTGVVPVTTVPTMPMKFAGWPSELMTSFATPAAEIVAVAVPRGSTQF